jgi:hypothetical protein
MEPIVVKKNKDGLSNGIAQDGANPADDFEASE